MTFFQIHAIFLASRPTALYFWKHYLSKKYLNEALTGTYTYSIYGELLSGETSQTGYLYNGAYGVYTDTNGLYYMRARYYNTNIERLISQDIPIGIAANAVNAVLYFQEGDILRGLLSVVGAVIGIGGLSNTIGAAKGICTLADSNTATVTNIAYEDTHATVYNFEVEDFHTYYVGTESVLVHNNGGNCMKTASALAQGGSKGGSKTIHNDILDSPRTGSALKVDDVNPIYKINEKTGKPQIVKEIPATAQSHGFNDIVDNYAGYATKTPLNNATLYQLDGSLNGVAGRFEWIIQDGNVTHRMFIQNGTMNGVPIKP